MLPSIGNVSEAQKIYKKVLSWKKIDDLLYNEFKNINSNIDNDEVAFKIILIDKLYNCNLMIDITKLAGSIVAKKIDHDLEKNNPVNLVKDIANIKIANSRKRVGLVFSSKYCHFHQPNRFPIYDTFARKGLSRIMSYPLNRYVWEYGLFKADIDNLTKQLNMKFTYKQIDVYLYLYGQWLDFKKGKEHISKNIRAVIESNKNRFKRLEPS